MAQLGLNIAWSIKGRGKKSCIGKIIEFVELLVNREKVEFLYKDGEKERNKKGEASVYVSLYGMEFLGDITYRFDEVNIRLPDKAVVRLENAFYATAALNNVPCYSSEQPDIGIGIDEDLEIH